MNLTSHGLESRLAGYPQVLGGRTIGEHIGMRALKYYVACTADRFIAHADGSFDGFLMEGEHVADFLESYKWFDTVLMGRKTYEVGLRAAKTNPYPMLRSYVFSRSMKASPDPNVTLISQNAVEVVRGLRSEAGKDIWLCGGADLAATFCREDLIDEVVLKVNPVLLGQAFRSLPARSRR